MPRGAVLDFVLATPLLPRLVGVNVTQGVVEAPLEGRPRLRSSSGHLEREMVGRERLRATRKKGLSRSTISMALVNRLNRYMALKT